MMQRLGRRISSALLLLFPPSFRREYGAEWLELAQRPFMTDRSFRDTVWSLARSLVGLLWETLRTAPGMWIPDSPNHTSQKRERASTMDSFFQDIRFGLRTLRKRPLFTLMAIGTLGLGIGATTSIFSVVEGVLLSPLPFDEPEELVSVWQTFPEWLDEPMLAQGWNRIYLSYTGYERWTEGQSHFQDVAIHGSTFRNLSGQGDPERIRVGIASSSLLRVLRVQPLLGRAFLPEEDQEGAPRVALISHAFWSERFGADPEVLGRSVSLNQNPFTIVGVMPPEFRLRGQGFNSSPGTKPVWIPMGAHGARRYDGGHSYEAVARLAPGASLEQATQEARRLVAAPDEEPGHSVEIISLEALELEGLRFPLLLLLGASLVLLLIACGNVATLLLGEFAGRRHEMATRSALGAGGRRLIRQLLTESVILGTMGGALGVVLALAGTRALLGLAPSLPRLEQIEVNPAVLLFAVGLGMVTGILFGLAPAWEVTKGRLAQTMGRRTRGNSQRGPGLQQMVISLELALTVVLLVSGVLLARSLSELMAVDTGFQREGVTMVRAYLPGYRYGSQEDRAVQAERMRLSLEGVPGVLAASGTSSLPFYNGPDALSYGIEGMEIPEDISPHANFQTILPGFFETMGIPILDGRPLSETDGLGGPPVAVISETMARRHWPDVSAIGGRILFGDTLEVVGVAADVVHQALDAKPMAAIYVPLNQEAGTSINFVVRSGSNPEALFPALRQAVWNVDAETPISRVATLPSLIRDSTRNERFRAVLIVVFAVCATLLAGTGVFGVTARHVAQRSREMGIRKAMGAEPWKLVRLALSGTARVGLVGVGLGLLGAAMASRLLTRFLFQVEPWDPATYLGAAGGLLLMSLIASLLPALRAGRVLPMEVLREE
jgi:putative ABC transport system permease protein